MIAAAADMFYVTGWVRLNVCLKACYLLPEPLAFLKMWEDAAGAVPTGCWKYSLYLFAIIGSSKFEWNCEP